MCSRSPRAANASQVATYHYDIMPVGGAGGATSTAMGGMVVEDKTRRGAAAAPADWKLFLVQVCLCC